MSRSLSDIRFGPYDAPAIDYRNISWLASAGSFSYSGSSIELRVVLRAMNAVGNTRLAELEDNAPDNPDPGDFFTSE